MEQVFSLAFESRGSVGHHSLALRGSNLATEVGLAGFAKLAFLALRSTSGFDCYQCNWFPVSLIREGSKVGRTRERRHVHRASRW